MRIEEACPEPTALLGKTGFRWRYSAQVSFVGSREIKKLLSCAVFVVCIFVVACASSGGEQLHTFSFDVRTENPDVEVLDYRYGEARIGPSSADPNSIAQGKFRQSASVGGYLPRGQSLYIKWRLRATGEVREDTVDLEARLPADISHHTITLMFVEGALFVYLITPQVLIAGQQSEGPRRYNEFKAYTVYPDYRSNLPRQR